MTRLDKNTTGLVLIAKHRHIHALFSKEEIDKFYLALVVGKVEDGIIEAIENGKLIGIQWHPEVDLEFDTFRKFLGLCDK